MNCDKAKYLLGWFHDGELHAADRQQVAAHVAGCTHCAAALAALTELDHLGQQLVAPESPPELWDRIAGRLGAPAAGRAATDGLLGRRPFLAVAAALGTSILGVLIYWFVRRRTTDGGDSRTSSEPGFVDPAGQDDPVPANLALLSSEDRQLAETQQRCASYVCHVRLGTFGPPVRFVVQGRPVFCCCPRCEQWARDHPAETMNKLHLIDMWNNKNSKAEKKP
jgi:hypothetical protein